MPLDRKPLIRGGSHSERSSMKNWPLFIFLIGLVLVFYVFYIYQAQSTALTMANDEIKLLSEQLSQSKSKLVDSLANLESVNSAQKTLTQELDDVKARSDNCQSSLRSSKLRLDSLEKNNKELSEQSTLLGEEQKSMKERSEELARNNTALTNMISAQESLIQQLNQTISLLKFEMEKIKSTTGNVEKTELKPKENVQQTENGAMQNKADEQSNDGIPSKAAGIVAPVEQNEPAEENDNPDV